MCHIKQFCDEAASLNLLAGVVAPHTEAHVVDISRPLNITKAHLLVLSFSLLGSVNV